MKSIKAKEGYVFMRKHDNYVIGNELVLGVDYSTGVAREDKEDYYEEIIKPIDEITT